MDNENKEKHSADLEQIRRGIKILFARGQVAELRALGKYGVTSAYFDNLKMLAAAIKRVSDSGQYEGVYYTLNPCDPALLSRREKNVTHERVKELTTDADILRRRWLLIDFDPNRVKGVSATRAEKRAARKVLIKVAEWLAKQGWPAPMVAVSGNGYHLLHRVDEPNDRATADLFKRVLQVIANQFSTDAVKIDTGVFNASRVVKAYGSLAAKGVSTPERPHRFSKMFGPPQTIEVVTRAQLEALAATSVTSDKPARQNGHAKFSAADRIDQFLESSGITVESRTEEKGSLKWKFACVFNPEHKDAVVFLRSNGALAYNCFHASCAENKWPQFRAWVEEKAGAKIRFTNNEPPYEATPNGLVFHKPNGAQDFLLTNFTARIVAETEEDDGAERRRRFEIEAMLDDRTERFEVAASQFSSMNWALDHLGARAVIYPPTTNRDHTRAATQLLSTSIEQRTVFTHMGWRRLGEEWAYLHSGGAITATGLQTDVSVSLPGALANFDLPSPPANEELKAAVRASVQMLDVAPDSVTVPVFAGIWRAPLGTCDLTLHICGPTGSGKTEYATLAQQHYGKAFTSRNLAAAWSGTANSLEAIAFAAKDALLVIDDFAPQGTVYEISRANRDAHRFIRAQGNNTGRSRMRPDATLQHTKSPRGLALSTGEDVPRGHSIRARMFVSELGERELNWERITKCQADAQGGLYEQAFAGYLQWLAASYESVSSWHQAKRAELRSRASKSADHKRTPEIVAQLAVGLMAFSRFAQSCSALSKPEAEALWQRCWRALGAVARQQREQQRAEEPASRFMELVNSLLASGAAHLADAETGRTPPMGARGVRIGWLDGELVFLEPGSAFAAVQRFAREQGDTLPVGAKTLWKRLQDKGYLAQHDKNRNLLTATVEGVRQRILALNANDVHVDLALRGYVQKPAEDEDTDA